MRIHQNVELLSLQCKVLRCINRKCSAILFFFLFLYILLFSSCVHCACALHTYVTHLYLVTHKHRRGAAVCCCCWAHRKIKSGQRIASVCWCSTGNTKYLCLCTTVIWRFTRFKSIETHTDSNWSDDSLVFVRCVERSRYTDGSNSITITEISMLIHNWYCKSQKNLVESIARVDGVCALHMPRSHLTKKPKTHANSLTIYSEPEYWHLTQCLSLKRIRSHFKNWINLIFHQAISYHTKFNCIFLRSNKYNVDTSLNDFPFF